jgi:septum formation protein
VVPDVDELGDGDPVEVARTNALRKCEAVAERMVSASDPRKLGSSDDVTLAVDTIVVLDGAIYGKPRDEAHARATLTALSGREHTVISGLALRRDGRTDVIDAHTRVRFRDVAPLLDWYLASGEWEDRAGGYAIQGRGAAFVTGIDGDYLNVVGLPVAALLDLWPGVVGQAR